MTSLALLKKCRELSALSEEKLTQLAARSFFAFAESGQIIWGPGMVAGYAGIVATGRVRIVASMDGREQCLARLSPSDTFCVAEAIEGRELPWCAVAETDCWYLKIPAIELGLDCASTGPLIA